MMNSSLHLDGVRLYTFEGVLWVPPTLEHCHRLVAMAQMPLNEGVCQVRSMHDNEYLGDISQVRYVTTGLRYEVRATVMGLYECCRYVIYAAYGGTSGDVTGWYALKEPMHPHRMSLVHCTGPTP